MRALGACLLLAAAATAACTDPTLSAVIDTLGPEAPGVPQGPEHRPGQPCVTCHHGSGPGSPDFSLAGTIYQDEEQALPLEGAVIDLVDSAERQYTVTSNCAGNFYVTADDWQPRFPVWVQVSHGEERILMETPIYRDGACASCHADPAGPDSVGHVFVFEEPTAGLPGGCR